MSKIKWNHNLEWDTYSGIVTKGTENPDKCDKFFLAYLEKDDTWVLSVRVSHSRYTTIFILLQEMKTDKKCISICKKEAEKYYTKMSVAKNGKKDKSTHKV